MSKVIGKIEPNKKPKVKLIGEDGNIFHVLGECTKVLLDHNYDDDYIKDFTDKCMRGDYDQALATIQQYFEVV